MATPFSILIIDDESAQAESISGFLRKKEYLTKTASSGEKGVALFEKEHFDIVLSDFKMPDITGEQVLQRVQQIQPQVPVILMTAYGSIESAVSLMKQGAFDYLQKPIDLEELLITIRRAEERAHLISENEVLKHALAERFSFKNIISQSDEMESVLNTVARVASSTASVLICGESGTGKELVARALHVASERKEGPIVSVNCAAIPETLFESELFGHEKGAFTGAEQRRIGKFEAANHGTLFIDEVGEIPLPIQVKLLRAIQSREIERLGGNEALPLDVRIVAATNRNMQAMVANGTFREDLYYRLNVVSILVPPLRNRKPDIPILAEHFAARYSKENGKEIHGVSREAMDALLRYDFPGNVRELENIIQRAVVMTRADTVTTTDLPAIVTRERTMANGEGFNLELGDLNAKTEAYEQALIQKALRETEGNQSKAAALLNISERTLRYKLKKND